MFYHFISTIADIFSPSGTKRRENLYLLICYLRKHGLLPNKRRVIDDLLETNFMPLCFPEINNPEVSIIIPVYNNFIYTYNCLKSILINTEGVRYEVIVVDNASTDKTVDLSNQLTNIVVIRNKENMGFVNACNTGAKKARGKYILFLNNDTKVTEGWLTSMVDVAERDSSVGAVGAKLIYPDGKLQEAGGIIWNDEQHMAWNYGRNQDPDNYEYNYLRDVDYCSGACLMVRKDIFETIGGFDTRFAPAYCEDTDLAFAVRKLGYRVIYQPKAEIIHFEGRTAGTDVNRGVKQFQIVNQKKLFQKWKTVLDKENFMNGIDVFLARGRSKDKKFILFVDHYVPTPDKDAGSLTMFMYLKLFLELGFRIIFVPDNYYKIEPYTTELQQMGIEVLYGALDFNAWIRHNGKYIHYVWLSRPNISIKYSDDIRRYTKAKVLYYMHDLHYLRELRRYEIEKNPEILKEAERWKKMELHICENVDTILTPSNKEVEILKPLFPSKQIINIPGYLYDELIIKGRNVAPFLKRHDILFMGGFNHLPNIDAVEFFLSEIYPTIKEQLPGIKFYIIGSELPDGIKKLAADDVIVVGYVKDLTSYFQNIRLFVSPLRYGAGVKGKIVTSMSYGVPVVTTSIGNEGLDMIDSHHCMIADKPDEFALKVANAYKDRELWEKLSYNSIEFVIEHFSKQVARKRILSILSENNLPPIEN